MKTTTRICFASKIQCALSWRRIQRLISCILDEIRSENKSDLKINTWEKKKKKRKRPTTFLRWKIINANVRGKKKSNFFLLPLPSHRPWETLSLSCDVRGEEEEKIEVENFVFSSSSQERKNWLTYSNNLLYKKRSITITSTSNILQLNRSSSSK